MLADLPGLGTSLRLTLLTGLGATALALILAAGTCAALHGRMSVRAGGAVADPVPRRAACRRGHRPCLRAVALGLDRAGAGAACRVGPAANADHGERSLGWGADPRASGQGGAVLVAGDAVGAQPDRGGAAYRDRASAGLWPGDRVGQGDPAAGLAAHTASGDGGAGLFAFGGRHGADPRAVEPADTGGDAAQALFGARYGDASARLGGGGASGRSGGAVLWIVTARRAGGEARRAVVAQARRARAFGGAGADAHQRG